MDASASELISKGTRSFEGQFRSKYEDRISNLPEHILHHILSFRPSKYAVGTSVLSTRWKDLWISVPYLDFCDNLLHSDWMEEHKWMFMNFVERVLLLHDAVYIHKFSLLSETVLDASRVNSWITSVLRRKVQEIILDFNVDNNLVFPHSLFTCESLMVLKISIGTVMKVSSTIPFSRVKVLHLKNLIISCDDVLKVVCFGCPFLEDLVLEDCRWLNIETVNISALALKSLKIYDYSGCKIKVSVESLVAFNLSSHLLSYELSLSNPSSLVNVSIDVPSMDCQLGRKFLRGICGVKDLILTDISFMAFSRANLTAMLKFSSLKHLTLYLETVYFNAENLTELLCNMPNIQSLLLINAHRFAFGRHGWTLGTTSQPILSNLKSVKFDEFYGAEKELSVVEVLLKNAKALEKMTIISSSKLSKDPERKMEVNKQLSMLPRGSTLCVIEFS